MDRGKLEKPVLDNFTIRSPSGVNFTSAPIFTYSLTDAETNIIPKHIDSSKHMMTQPKVGNQ